MSALRRLAGTVVATGAALALAAVPAAAHGDDHRSQHGGGPEVAAARRATAGFHRVEVAEGAGYGILADAAGLTCIEDPDGTGAMGTHFVNGPLVSDAVVDATQPEVLLYDMSAPHPRLLGVEYVVFVSEWGEDREPPELFGQQFHLVEQPNRYGLPPFYELHAWLWETNPSGFFEDWNPRIAC